MAAEHVPVPLAAPPTTTSAVVYERALDPSEMVDRNKMYATGNTIQVFSVRTVNVAPNRSFIPAIDMRVLTATDMAPRDFALAPTVVKKNRTNGTYQAFVFAPESCRVKLVATASTAVRKPYLYKISFAIDRVHNSGLTTRRRTLTLNGRVETIPDVPEIAGRSDDDTIDNDEAQVIRASVNLMKYVSQERNVEEGEEEDAVVNVCEDTKKRLRYAPAPRAAKAARPGHECIVDRYEHVFELMSIKIYYSNVPGLLAMGVSPGALQRAGVPASLLPGDSSMLLCGLTKEDAIAVDDEPDTNETLSATVRARLTSCSAKWPRNLVDRIIAKVVDVLEGCGDLDEVITDNDVCEELKRALKMVEEIGASKAIATVSAIKKGVVQRV